MVTTVCVFVAECGAPGAVSADVSQPLDAGPEQQPAERRAGRYTRAEQPLRVEHQRKPG